MFHTLHNVRIAGLRTAVPACEVRLDDEAEFYSGSAKKVARLHAMLGMDRRRVSPPDVTASDLCAHAAEALLASMADVRESIDALIFVSQSPDWYLPATACELQHRLGLPQQCAAFDVNQGCAGYIYGLWMASSLVASGAARHVLLLAGDGHSYGRDPRNRITTPVFGDGGSATLLKRDEQAPPMHFSLGTDGSGFEVIITPGGRARIPFVRDPQKNIALCEDIFDAGGNPWQLMETYMDGGAVFNFTMQVVPQHIKNVLQSASVTPDDVNWLILHQANKQIVESIAEAVGFPLSKAPSASFSKYGNTAVASIPIALCEAFGQTETKPGNMLLCGYGVGLSWGSCLCHADSWNIGTPLDFEASPDRPTREQRIARWQQRLRGEIKK